MENKEYNLYCAVSSVRNQLIGYPLNFSISEEFHRLVGKVRLSSKDIIILRRFEDRWESGIEMYLPRAFGSQIGDFSNDVVKSMEAEWGSRVDTEMLRDVLEKASFVDVDIYLNRNGSFYGSSASNVVLCRKGKNMEDILDSNERRSLGEDLVKVGEVEKVPLGLLKMQRRYIVDSCRSDIVRAEPQILLPHKSLFNHAHYGLGRYDNRD